MSHQVTTTHEKRIGFNYALPRRVVQRPSALLGGTPLLEYYESKHTRAKALWVERMYAAKRTVSTIGRRGGIFATFLRTKRQARE
jgi:hypothetical protein